MINHHLNTWPESSVKLHALAQLLHLTCDSPISISLDGIDGPLKTFVQADDFPERMQALFPKKLESSPSVFYRRFDSDLINSYPVVSKAFTRITMGSEQDREQFLETFYSESLHYLRSPYTMVGTDKFNECEHFIFFDVLHFIKVPGHTLPKVLWEINGELIDYSSHLHEIFDSLVVFRRKRGFNLDGFDNIPALLTKLFMARHFGHNPYATVIELWFSQIPFLDELTHRERKFYFYADRLLRIFRLVFLSFTGKSLRAVYMGMEKVYLGEHIRICNNLKVNAAAFSKWKQYDERQYRFILSNYKLDATDFSYFSPENLVRNDVKSGFVDKRSVKKLMSLNSRLFSHLLQPLVDQQYSFNVAVGITHWLAYTQKYQKPNTYCVLVLSKLLRDKRGLLIADIYAYPQKVVILLDILYELIEDLWANYKKYSSLFIQAAYAYPQFDQLLDYLFHHPEHQGENNFFADRRFNYNKINSKSSLRSLTRKAHEWHQESLRSSMDFYDYNVVLPELTVGKYLFSPIRSTEDIIDERQEMQHCIATFNLPIATRRYLAFRVTGNGERATLGITVERDSHSINHQYVFKFNQCYGVYNQKVSEPLMLAAQTISTTLAQLSSNEIWAGSKPRTLSTHSRREVFLEF